MVRLWAWALRFHDHGAVGGLEARPRACLVHEDWRYDQIRGHGLSLLYWQVSLVSLHLTTTSRPACSCTARSALSVGSLE